MLHIAPVVNINLSVKVLLTSNKIKICIYFEFWQM